MNDVQRIDDVLKCIMEHGQNIHRTTIQNYFHDKKQDIDVHSLNVILRQMVKDGVIDKVHDAEPIYLITYKGIGFYEDGGYANQRQLEDDKEAEEERRQDLEERQIQSVIDTNENVRKTNTIQKVALILTIIFTAATLVVSVLDYVKDSAPKITVTPAPVQVFQPQPVQKDTNAVR